MANKNPLGLPTEFIDLPSKGLVHPTDHPLSAGKVEVVYPSAKQEDILTNYNYIDKGLSFVVDKYLDSILITEVDLNDFIPGDKDGLMIAARVLGLGKNYSTSLTIDSKPEVVTFDLTQLQEKPIDLQLFKQGVNEFSYTLERGVNIKFKIMNGKEAETMFQEEQGIKKTSPQYSADTTLYLKHAITEVDGKRGTKDIRDFVDRMLQRDARELKNYMKSITPGYIWRANGVRANKEVVEDLYVPYTADFFWPLS